MATTNFMVAIELGSTRIMGVAGQKDLDGSLTILAYASEDASTCIRKGVVFNIDKTAQAITSIINKLEATLDASIAKVYVGISGQSLHTVRNTVGKQLDGETRITANIVNELIALNRSSLSDEYDILEVLPQEYKVGSGMQIDPVGVIANHIDGHFLNIVARPGVKQKIESCFELACTNIAGYFIAPIEMAKVVLNDAEYRSGCALVDFGAETTTVQVYKDHILRHLTVLPLGGSSLTKDICSLNIEEADAEGLKVKYASAYTEPSEEGGHTMNYTYGSGESTITDQLLNEICEARMEEIIVNVKHQINLSGYADKLLGGIIVTGGASLMNGLQTAFIKKTGFEKFKIATYVIPSVESVSPEPLEKNARMNTLLGLLHAAQENCREPEPIKGNLFDEDGESALASADSERLAKEQLLEQQKAEAARIAQEQEAARAAEVARIAQEKAEQEAAERRAEEERLEAERLARIEEEKRRKRESSLFGRLQKWGKKLADDIVNGDE